MLSWLGIGAQRSGTSWFTELLVQHDDCSLGRSGEKELHILDRALEHQQLDVVRRAYETEFGHSSSAAGEFTPSYLRALWAAEIATRVLDPKVVIVLLRDPIERFHSALRLTQDLQSRRRPKRSPGFFASRAIEAQWGSSYLPQLDAWTAAMGSDRMLVLQYEAVVADPAAAVQRAWRRMGLTAMPLVIPDRPESAAQPDYSSFDIDRALGRLLGPQIAELEAWGIDLDLWPRLRAVL